MPADAQGYQRSPSSSPSLLTPPPRAPIPAPAVLLSPAELPRFPALPAGPQPAAPHTAPRVALNPEQRARIERNHQRALEIQAEKRKQREWEQHPEREQQQQQQQTPPHPQQLHPASPNAGSNLMPEQRQRIEINRQRALEIQSEKRKQREWEQQQQREQQQQQQQQTPPHPQQLHPASPSAGSNLTPEKRQSIETNRQRDLAIQAAKRKQSEKVHEQWGAASPCSQRPALHKQGWAVRGPEMLGGGMSQAETIAGHLEAAITMAERFLAPPLSKRPRKPES